VDEVLFVLGAYDALVCVAMAGIPWGNGEAYCLLRLELVSVTWSVNALLILLGRCSQRERGQSIRLEDIP